MISVVGIGNGASNIAKNFAVYSQYEVYTLNDKEDDSKDYRHYRLESFEDPEKYEESVPDLKKFFKDMRAHIQVFIVGSSYSSNYSLGILEQVKDKKIDSSNRHAKTDGEHNIRHITAVCSLRPDKLFYDHFESTFRRRPRRGTH